MGHTCPTCGIEKPSPGGLAVHELIHLSEAPAPAPPPPQEPSAHKPTPKPKTKTKPKDKPNRHGAQGRRRWTLGNLEPSASVTALLVVANLLGATAAVLSHSSLV